MAESLVHKETGPGSPIDARPYGSVRIMPNRHQIDRRFPSLGFTVETGGLPFFEVLLATDRTLFSPANAGRRNPANFYASRLDSGLIRTDPLGAVYMAPVAVLQAFAGQPEIYYTAIAYRSPHGNGPAFAQTPAELPSAAPSVSVSPDLQKPGIAASVLGVPVSKLLRLRDDGSLSMPPETAPLAAEENGHWGPPSTLAGSEDGEYDDGFGEPLSEASTWSLSGPEEEEDAESFAAESTFPAGAAAPPMLEDEDDDGSAAYAAGALSHGEDGDDVYDDGFGAADEDGGEAASYEYGAATGYDEVAEYREAAESGEDGYDEASGFALGDEETPPSAGPEAAAQPLSIPDKRRILEQLAVLEPGTGVAGQLGLTYWIAESGHLGRLLEMACQRDDEAATVARLFGDQLRGLARVQRGGDLRGEPWLSLFREAAKLRPFRAAQNELASLLFLEPMLPFARWLGLNTDRALALVVDRAMQMGPDAARRWIIAAAGPLQSQAQRQQALAALGHTDLASFQSATQGLEADGVWSARTHAALGAALRAPGVRSPVPIPDRDQMLRSLARQAAGQPWETRTASLLGSQAFTDEVFAL